MAHPYASSRNTDRVSKMTTGYPAGDGDVGRDSSLDRNMIRRLQVEDKMDGEPPRRANGGRVKGRGKTNITINVQPPTAGPQGAVPPIPMPVPPGIMGPPPAPPPMPPKPIPLGAMGVVPPGGPGGGPPMRKAGGAVKRADGGATFEAGSGRSMLEDRKSAGLRKETGNYSGPAERQRLLDGEGPTKRKSGGRVADGPAWKEGLKNGTQVSHTRSNAGDHFDDKRAPAVRKAGGAVIAEEGTGSPKSGHVYPRMKYGAESGLGRLQKITGQKRGG